METTAPHARAGTAIVPRRPHRSRAPRPRPTQCEAARCACREAIEARARVPHLSRSAATAYPRYSSARLRSDQRPSRSILSDLFGRSPGERNGLEWFHKLLVRENLDDRDGAVVEASREAVDARIQGSPVRRTGSCDRDPPCAGKGTLGAPAAPRPKGWRIAGVLIESLEPIVRPDEVDLDAIGVGAGSLPLRSSNSAQSRLLFVGDAAVELVPGADAAVVLQYRHRRIDGVDDAGQLVHAEANRQR